MSKKFAFPIILISLCALFIYCDGDNGPGPSFKPVLSDIELVDSVHYADSQTVSVFVADPDGPEDIDSVWGNYRVPGNMESIRYIQFYDDGTHGDAYSSDQRFTIRCRPQNGFVLAGYVIAIGAVDKSGNQADWIDTSFTAIDTTTSSNPILSEVELEFFHFYRDSQTVSVLVTDPYESDEIDSVWGRYYFDEINPIYAHVLFNDDGANGDLTAGDSRYTTMFIPDSGAFALDGHFGNYIVNIWAVDSGGNQSLQYDTLFIAADSIGLTAPVLINLDLDIIHNYNDSQTVSVFVGDPQGYDNIDSVWGWYFFESALPVIEDLLFYDDGTHGDISEGDGRFTITFMADTGVFDIGLHYLAILAVDNDGHQSDQLDTSFTTVGNPTLSNPIAPDSLRRIPGDTAIATITIDAYDPDGLTNIDSVYFISYLEGYPPSPHFHLYDDGDSVAHGDLSPGDGTYSIIIAVYDSNTPGDYLFRFYAWDREGNGSNNPEIIITVY